MGALSCWASQSREERGYGKGSGTEGDPACEAGNADLPPEVKAGEKPRDHVDPKDIYTEGPQITEESVSVVPSAEVQAREDFRPGELFLFSAELLLAVVVCDASVLHEVLHVDIEPLALALDTEGAGDLIVG